MTIYQGQRTVRCNQCSLVFGESFHAALEESCIVEIVSQHGWIAQDKQGIRSSVWSMLCPTCTKEAGA